MRAELVRVELHQVDIKIINNERMHILQWRRNMLWDEVLLDGKRQAASRGLWGREKVYGLIFGRDDNGAGGEQVMLLIDPESDYNWSADKQKIKGVRLEAKDGPIISYGTLDANALKKPATFAEWMKKSMGMAWGQNGEGANLH